jgi:hypothetical protein
MTRKQRLEKRLIARVKFLLKEAGDDPTFGIHNGDKAVCEWLDVHRHTVRRWREDGTIPRNTYYQAKDRDGKYYGPVAYDMLRVIEALDRKLRKEYPVIYDLVRPQYEDDDTNEYLGIDYTDPDDGKSI